MCVPLISTGSIILDYAQALKKIIGQKFESLMKLEGMFMPYVYHTMVYVGPSKPYLVKNAGVCLLLPTGV